MNQYAAPMSGPTTTSVSFVTVAASRRRLPFAGQPSPIKTECPAVTRKDSYMTLGRFDVVDIVESNDLKQLERAALLIRAYGHARTETLQGTPWKESIASL
ncbi:MAG: GYD domain-containing protein [Cupriavidus necator]